MKLSVAIVGCGKIADAHVEQVRATGLAEVVAVCDREPLMAEQLAIRMAVPRHFADLEELLRTQHVDVVHVATPPDSHLALARLAFAKGCHVFLEKPVALTAAETRAIVAAARSADRKLAVNYLYNFESPSIELKALLALGRLGNVVHVESNYGYDLRGDYGIAVLSDPGHWVHRLPGKLFHNVLDHLVCKLALVMPRAEPEVRCIALRRRDPVGDPVIDRLADELRFTILCGGVSATGMVSAHIRPNAHTMCVYGERDSVALDYVARTLVPVARQVQPSALGRLFPAWTQSRRFASSGLRNAGRFLRHEFHFFQGMRVLLSEFYRGIADGGPPPIPYDDILWSVDVIDRMVTAMAAAPTTASS